MRISVREDDPGYLPQEQRRSYEVYLNGVQLFGVITADEGADTILRHKRDDHGRLVEDGGFLIEEVVKGRVEIWRKGDPMKNVIDQLSAMDVPDRRMGESYTGRLLQQELDRHQRMDEMINGKPGSLQRRLYDEEMRLRREGWPSVDRGHISELIRPWRGGAA